MDLDDLIADAARAFRASKFTFGSLWWISEAVWRRAQLSIGVDFRSTKDSHPGTVVGSSQRITQRIYLHNGRTTWDPLEDGIIVEMRPGKTPTQFTKFAGKSAFIGQIPTDCLLKWEDDDYHHRPASELWLHRNHPLPDLAPEDQEDLQVWVDQIFSA